MLSTVTDHPRRGAKTAPRLYLTSAFLERASREPGWMLARYGNWTHYQGLSHFLKTGIVRGTPLNVARFQRLADAIGIPRDRIFEVSR